MAGHLCMWGDVMSGQTATVEAATETTDTTETTTHTSAVAQAKPAAEPEVTIQDVLVEDVSIDGMCGVY
jgi:mycofactocin precursor